MKKVKVQYRLYFTNIKALEYTPLSNAKVLLGQTKVRIEREFPNIGKIQKPTPNLTLRLQKYLATKLRGHKVSYTTQLSDKVSITMQTDKGEFLKKENKHVFSYSLEKSIQEAKKPTIWSLTLQKNQ